MYTFLHFYELYLNIINKFGVNCKFLGKIEDLD